MADDNSNYTIPDTWFKIRQPRSLYWMPKQDITAYELALCQDLLRIQVSGYGGGDLYDCLPDSAKRHWIVRGGDE